jgi:hypothetical protein
MFERRELILKIAVGVTAGLVLYELGLFLAHINPLWRLKIPALPTLPGSDATAASSKGTNTTAKGTGSNTTQQVTAAKGTNSSPQATNVSAQAHNVSARETNSAARGTNGVSRGTNLVAGATNLVSRGTNLLGEATNAVSKGTNVLAAAPGTSRGSTNSVVASNAPPAVPGNMMAGPPVTPPGMPPGVMVMGPGGPGMPPGGRFMGPGGPGMGKPGPELAPEVQARLDRIIESEILGPVMRPLPMALLGIAGPHIFLRAPNGQTGLIKEGEELGGVKLVRIGTNRVLVEEKGEQKELTIFSGFGSESLMSAKKDSLK